MSAEEILRTLAFSRTIQGPEGAITYRQSAYYPRAKYTRQVDVTLDPTGAWSVFDKLGPLTIRTEGKGLRELIKHIS